MTNFEELTTTEKMNGHVAPKGKKSHLKDKVKIETLLHSLKLTNRQKEKVNKLRLQCQNEII
jgi:hypothetical protein